MIVRGTTPYHTFIVPMISESIEEIYVTYLQNNEVILDKDKNDVTIKDIVFETENAELEDTEEIEVEPEPVIPSSEVTLHLTQEDTLKFHFYPAAEKNIARVQIRILDTNGEAYASDPAAVRIFDVYKEGVIPINETDTDTETNG